jgi:hypothetical protein
LRRGRGRSLERGPKLPGWAGLRRWRSPGLERWRSPGLERGPKLPGWDGLGLPGWADFSSAIIHKKHLPLGVVSPQTGVSFAAFLSFLCVNA